MNKKVLIAAPQHESKNYCWEEWSNRIDNLTYSNYDVFIADNSKTKDNYKKIKKYGYKCQHIPQNEKGLVSGLLLMILIMRVENIC